MSTVAEGDEGVFHDIDFSQLLDLPEATFFDLNDPAARVTAADDEASLLVQGGQVLFSSNLNIGLAEQWPTDIPHPADPPLGLEEPDYSKFENFIPSLVRLDKACDYCRSKRLACYMYRGDLSCTPCNALFRECSLTATTMEASNYADKRFGTLLDTLHTVDEDACRERGTTTGVKSLASKNRQSGHSTPVFSDDAPGSSKRNGIRFPRHAVKVLREWLDSHSSNPYPTEKEKEELERKTELKSNQIGNWLANARRRRKATGKPSHPRVGMSPSLQPTTPAIEIPELEKPWDELNPLERWKNSPPEHEPARMKDIANAVAHSDIPESNISRSPSSGRRKRSSNGSGLSSLREPSTTSLDTSAQTSSLSASSAALSHGSSQSHGSFGSFSSGLAGKRDRKRRRRPATLSQRPTDDKKRIFQCTFCTDTFKSKYDWTRHEKSLHLSLEKWFCAPLGPVLSDPVTGHQKCVYCDALDPSDAHIEGHNHRACEDKGLDSRTFFRKDHVRQHLRLMHSCDMIPQHDTWRHTIVNINSRCGFCAKRFNVWQDRVDHLTAHFKAGSRMSEWKGCRGLDPSVAAQVTNAMPPYLIGIESVSPVPFSASNQSTCHHPIMNFMSSKRETEEQRALPTKSDLTNHGEHTTCWEVLTVRLGKYANEMAQQGAVLTDEMLQVQARRILYDSDDAWNQTAADNPEWLDLFKKAHGLDFIPQAIGGEGLAVAEDPELYTDLGLRIPFAVQLRAYNSIQAETSVNSDLGCMPSCPQKRPLAKASGDVYALLTKEGLLHDGNHECHGECQANIIDVSLVDDSSAPGPRLRKWCKYQIPPDTLHTLITNSYGWHYNGATGDRDQVSVGILPSDVQPQFDLNARGMRTDGCHTMEDSQPLRAAQTQRNSTQAAVAEAHLDNSLGSQEQTRADMNTAKSSRARASALMTLSRIEAAQWDDCEEPHTTYLPYHKHELPDDRARLFATVTGPWQDSGVMPAPLTRDHDPPGIEWQDMTTTGAMVEFLGGGLSQNLPFLNDASTATIPLQQQMHAGAAEPSAFDSLTLDDIDDFIAATAAPQSDMVAAESAPTQQPSAASAVAAMSGMTTDVTMADASVDDMDFDAIFDMHIEDDYNGGSLR